MRRALKRRLSDAVYRRITKDQQDSSTELGLAGSEVATRNSFEWDNVDALDTDIAQVGHGGQVGEQGGRPDTSKACHLVGTGVRFDRESTVDERYKVLVLAFTGRPF